MKENDYPDEGYPVWAEAKSATATLTDGELDALIHAADLYARAYDAREFGLPTHSEAHMEKMRQEMRAASKESGNG